MRVGLLLLLMLVTIPASAKWLKISETDAFTIFADPKMIRVDGNLRRAWLILELKERQPNGELSRRVLWEWDCKEERDRVLHLISLAGHMGTGKVLLNGGNPVNWNTVSPNVSASTVLFRFACSAANYRRNVH